MKSNIYNKTRDEYDSLVRTDDHDDDVVDDDDGQGVCEGEGEGGEQERVFEAAETSTVGEGA